MVSACRCSKLHAAGVGNANILGTASHLRCLVPRRQPQCIHNGRGSVWLNGCIQAAAAQQPNLQAAIAKQVQRVSTFQSHWQWPPAAKAREPSRGNPTANCGTSYPGGGSGRVLWKTGQRAVHDPPGCIELQNICLAQQRHTVQRDCNHSR